MRRGPEALQPESMRLGDSFNEPLRVVDHPYIYTPEPLSEFIERKVPVQNRETFAVLTHLALPIAAIHDMLKKTLYPSPARRSNESIAKAAETDPTIFHPFTVVREGWGRQLPTIPYHLLETLPPHLYQCQVILHKAADTTTHREMGRGFREVGTRMFYGDFDGLLRWWVQAPPFPIHLQLGSFESYDDTRFGTKTSFHLNLGVHDEDGTKLYNDILNMFRQQRFFIRDLLDYEPDDEEVVRLEAIQGGLFGALQAEKRFVGEVLPNYPEQRRKWGAKILLILNQYDVRFHGIFESIGRHFSGRAWQELPDKKTLQTLSLAGLFPTEEQAHLWIHLPDARLRLEGMYHVMNEAVAGMLPLIVAARQFERREISEEDFKNLLVVQLGETFVKIDAGAFDAWTKGQDPLVFFEGNEHLARDLIIFGRLIRDEALTLGLHSTIVDFDLRAAVDSLRIMSKLYSELYRSGTKEDARHRVSWDLKCILNTEIFRQMQWAKRAEETKILPINPQSSQDDAQAKAG